MSALKEKVALVTGGSSGIGAAIAIKFSQEGAKVAIVGRNEKKLRNVATSCEQIGNKPLVIIADVTNDDDLRRVVSETLDHFGKLDVLVNNAGVAGTVTVTDEHAVEVFDRMIATNLRPAIALTSLAAPHLIKTKGNIVNISSVVSTALILRPGFAYSVSKAGLDHYTRFAAMELASEGVRVNSVNPGPVRTDIVKNVGIDDESFENRVWESWRKGTALGRISDPEEVADLVLFLTSDKARGITGSSYLTDNGVLLKSKM